MATDVGSLFISLGLNLSDLETDFIAADRTVTENVRRLNRESEIIRLRSQVEIAGLDETADAERILQIRTDALNRQMQIQRDRVRILTAELQSLTNAHGENAAITQRATIRLERERLALANLERESRNLGETSDETNSIFGELSSLLPEMPTKLGLVQMAFGAVTAGISAAGAATKELLDEFRELQNQSYELNMSFPDTRKFLREMRLAGGDIGDYEGFIRGISDAYVKGEYDDPEFIALRKYGAEIVDATGRLKDFKEISEEVYQAWLKADEAGEGIEFLQLMGGEAGVRDAIQYFQRLKEAREDASKIFKAEIDDSQLHKLDRTLNLVTEQSSELKTAIGNIFVPSAQAAAESFFNVLHKGTEYLTENKDALQKLQFVAVELFDNLAPHFANAFVPRLGFESIWENIKGILPDEKLNPDSPASKFLESFSFEKLNPDSPISKTIADITEKYKSFKGELEDTDSVSGKVAKGLAALSDAQKKHGDVLSQYGIQRVKIFKDELADLQIELEFGDNDYKKSLAQLDLWLKRELEDKLYVSGEERGAINELYAAKLEQIEQERADKLAEIRASVEAADKTALQNKLDTIEKERQAWLKAGMDKAEAEKLAEQQKADYIKNIEQELSDNINSLQQSDLEKQLARIEKEKQAWISKGASEAQAEQLAQAQREQAYQNQEKTLNEIRDSVMALDRTELENKLANIEKERQAWIQKGMDELEATELAQRKSSKAYEESLEQDRSTAEKHSKAIAQAYQDAAKKRQAAEEEAARKNKALRDEALNVLRQEAKEFETFLKEGYSGLQKLMQDKLIKSGVNPDLLKQMTPEKLEAYKSAREDAQRSFLPNWKDPYSAEPVKVNLPENLDKTSQAANTAAKSLDVLAKSALNAAGGGEQDFSASPENVSMERQPLRVYTKPDGATEITNMTCPAEATPIANDFSVVAKEAEQSLKDFGAQAQRSAEQINVSQYENPGSMPTDAYQPALSEAPVEITSVLNSFGELSTVIQGVSANLSSMAAPEYAATGNPFSYIEPELQNFIQTFSIMGAGVGEVTIKINELSAALESLLRQQTNTPSTETRQPVNVNTSVSIEEAHAWDYNHIQELADKVADIIKPEIISAIGGDSNSY